MIYFENEKLISFNLKRTFRLSAYDNTHVEKRIKNHMIDS